MTSPAPTQRRRHLTGSPGTAGPRSACSPASTCRRRRPATPAQTWTPDSSRLQFRNCCGSCVTSSSTAPARPGPPAALVGLATLPPAPRLPSPPALERLRRDNAVITTNHSCPAVEFAPEPYSVRVPLHQRLSRHTCRPTRNAEGDYVSCGYHQDSMAALLSGKVILSTMLVGFPWGVAICILGWQRDHP